ncbi:hypothetical protein [Coraliomargarita parva]|uniref:hypothetical protein n=1 Tax=Coraliomargarita parva TaxID=3014050 RepID=UPI0022B3FFEB|nr:hypothetical protein [Coraliomargarita parva]
MQYRHFHMILLVLLGGFLAGCATSSSTRISKNEALFNTYTPEERKLIRLGEVAVGFDQEQVRMALGAPSRESTVETAEGKQIVWEYRRPKPNLGLGLGIGGGTRGVGLGGGVGIGANTNSSNLQKRIIFDRNTGTVSKVESYD